MFVAVMAFFAKVRKCNQFFTYLNVLHNVDLQVSDPAVGGTYMTLLNTGMLQLSLLKVFSRRLNIFLSDEIVSVQSWRELALYISSLVS